MTEAVAVVNQAAVRVEPVVDWRSKLDVIRKTVAKDASNEQLEMFLHLANRYQLDPFTREIYYSPQTGVITSRDGYLKVAQRDPEYEGIVSCAVHANDEFEMKPMECDIRHVFANGDRGEIIGAYAVCFRKGRRPAVCYATYSEYAKNTPVWNTYKSAMICKVAEVMALKRQFSISGLVTEEEVVSNLDEISPRSTAPRSTAPRSTAPRDEREALKARIDELRAGYAAIGQEEHFDAICESKGKPTNLKEARELVAVLQEELTKLTAATMMPQAKK